MKLGILGANGRMGQFLIEASQQVELVTLGAAIVRANSPFFGEDAGRVARIGETGVSCTSLSSLDPDDADVLIDFTLPEALATNLDWCVQHNKPLVIGTTGLTQAQFDLIDNAANSIPVFWAANYSLGVNVMLSLVQQAAKALGSLADIDIIEAHHRHKLDSPSGTAIAIGEAIAQATDRNLNECAVYGHQTTTQSRSRDDIGFAVVRGGDIVGEHTALFACDGERLEVTHKASTRMTFARGAVNAAVWLGKQTEGRYSMQELVSHLVGKS